MWIPGDAEEIETAAASGSLEETASFDGKAELPRAKKNSDLAVDVAAMSTAGGVLIYGLGEDGDERLTVLNPIELAGASERIDQIVSTSIAEVPYIEVKEHPLAQDSSMGYVSVLIPQSARAPHMVVVGGENRYYGRGAKGNRRLSEAEVARLYGRRREWDQDRDALLVEAIGQAPFTPQDYLAYLHGFTRPVAPDRAIWDRAVEAVGGRAELQRLISERVAGTRPKDGYAPNLKGGGTWVRHGGDEWRLAAAEHRDYDELRSARYVVDVRINIDGRGHLFCGRGGERVGRAGPDRTGLLAIFESVIAGNFTAFLTALGTLYEAAGYHGHVDLGLVVTGLRGGFSSLRQFGFEDELAYNADTYPRTERVAAGELVEPEPVAGRVLRHLFEATTGSEDYNPFEEARGTA